MYSWKNVVLKGFALFAMLFGAGNLIFPPMLGKTLADSWAIGTMGFILTGVGFPLLGILSTSLSGKKDIEEFANKVSPWFAKLFFIALILAIGPLLAIPRTGATAYEITFLHAGLSSSLYKYIYLILYFGITLLFSLKANKVVDRIGSILTPVLLIMLFIIIVKGVSSPLGIPVTGTILTPFKNGFVEGYQTMDTLASIVFAGVILKSIRGDKDLSPKQEFAFLVQVSIIACLGLSIVYGGLSFIGASVSSMGSELGKTELLVNLTTTLLGRAGYAILGICVAGACLTTAIGLVATVADYFSKISSLSYEKLAVLTTIISFIFACFGVDMIVKISVPILVFLYPLAMALILLNVFKIQNHAIFKGACFGAGIISFYEMLGVLGLQSEALSTIYGVLPFSSLGFAWLIPAILGGVFFRFVKKN
ncbi:branched-chain amino acid transport system II carrier protein [Fusobacterium necrophorum]|uniref:Branched-chain amino acid transport system II carrier protein n=1 Tax=Fusobacterium necrophorum TaxID=859 RepID=A0A4Q2L450_9FUSO|nr:branched-chain amino acid transport system II carrier protein [Fusobacterium necrophorum]RXZ70881.1 branched-chain amino acid transport system II carrier protein [Fusobacterium necrophorum]